MRGRESVCERDGECVRGREKERESMLCVGLDYVIWL